MKEKIYTLLTEEFPDIDFNETGLIDNGILDSINLVEIISCLSMEFGVEIPYEEIIPDNFNSVQEIADLLERIK